MATKISKQQADELIESFEKFVEHYVNLMGFKMGDIQRELAAFMTHGDLGIRIHVFRGVGKSFLLDLYCIWRILRCWDTKILIVSAKEENASTHISELEKLIGLSPLTCGWLDSTRTANKSTLDFGFSAQEAAPSIRCVGIESTIEGSRADLILADDIEAGPNSRTDAARAWLVKRMDEFENIIHPTPRFTDPDVLPELTQIVVVGTYWSPMSVYVPPTSGEDMSHPLKGFPVFQRGALDHEDKSTFPERFSTRVLHRKRAKKSHEEWTLQFVLDLSQLSTMSGAVNFDKIIRNVVPHNKLHTITMALDPVGERIKGRSRSDGRDEIAFTIGGLIRGPSGQLNRLHIINITGSSKDSSEDFMRHVVVPAILEFNVMRIQVESNQPAAYNLMRRILIEQRVTSCGVMEPYQARGDKHDRLISFLEPNIDGGLVSFDQSVLDDDATSHQLKALTYHGMPRRNDRIDSLAQLIEIFTPHLGIPDTKQDWNSVYVRDA